MNFLLIPITFRRLFDNLFDCPMIFPAHPEEISLYRMAFLHFEQFSFLTTINDLMKKQEHHEYEYTPDGII